MSVCLDIRGIMRRVGCERMVMMRIMIMNHRYAYLWIRGGRGLWHDAVDLQTNHVSGCHGFPVDRFADSCIYVWHGFPNVYQQAITNTPPGGIPPYIYRYTLHNPQVKQSTNHWS